MNTSGRAPTGGWLAAVVLMIAACSPGGGVTTADPWSREVPPVSPASAVFFEITNNLDTLITMTGGTSVACGSIELHETSIDENNVMAMRPLVGGLIVEPGESVVLAPGGLHLMCVEPKVFTGSFDVGLSIEGAPDMTISVSIEDR